MKVPKYLKLRDRYKNAKMRTCTWCGKRQPTKLLMRDPVYANDWSDVPICIDRKNCVARVLDKYQFPER